MEHFSTAISPLEALLNDPSPDITQEDVFCFSDAYAELLPDDMVYLQHKTDEQHIAEAERVSRQHVPEHRAKLDAVLKRTDKIILERRMKAERQQRHRERITSYWNAAQQYAAQTKRAIRAIKETASGITARFTSAVKRSIDCVTTPIDAAYERLQQIPIKTYVKQAREAAMRVGDTEIPFPSLRKIVYGGVGSMMFASASFAMYLAVTPPAHPPSTHSTSVSTSTSHRTHGSTPRVKVSQPKYFITHESLTPKQHTFSYRRKEGVAIEHVIKACWSKVTGLSEKDKGFKPFLEVVEQRYVTTTPITVTITLPSDMELQQAPVNVYPALQDMIVSPYTRITSTYGRRIHNNHAEFHNGWDIAAAYGAEIKALYDGVVRLGNNPGEFFLDDGLGNVTGYAHAQSRSIRYGHYVKKGEHIALMGKTETEQPHLHFTYIQSGEHKDPFLFFAAVAGKQSAQTYLARLSTVNDTNTRIK